MLNTQSSAFRNAFFSDTTQNFIFPAEPEKYGNVTISMRAPKQGVEAVYIVRRSQQIPLNKIEEGAMASEWDGMLMHSDRFDYYSCQVTLGTEKFAYYFAIITSEGTIYYDTRGVVDTPEDAYRFAIIPGFKTPAWAKGAVMYQIYTDRFCNGDPSNDVLTGEYCYINEPVKRVEEWSRVPAQMDVREFYGGDLQGVMDKLDYLQDLGVEVIYFNPLFVSPSNHKYDSQDYDYIDPHLGKIINDRGELLADGETENRFATLYKNRVTNKENLEASNALFAKLVEEAHKRGIRVILDGVFNHCGSFNKWLDRERIYEDAEGYEKGAYVSADSAYRSYFDFKDPEGWPYNGSYDGWWNHATLPKLNYEESEKLCRYVMKIAKKWVSAPFFVDGWRLDVAADLGHSREFNHFFWKEFRKAVKEANPEALILAEHYGNTKEWLQGEEWDSVMNYDAFMEPVTWFLTGMEKHSDGSKPELKGDVDYFWRAMHYHNASFSNPSLQVAMNELSNHDHSRFLTRTNGKVGRAGALGADAAREGIRKGIFREAVVMQMTWPGAPTLYYGDEAGVCGFTDPDNRRTYPWGREDYELIRFHKDMIRLHKEYPEFKAGSLKPLEGDRGFLSYGRFTGRDISVVLINNNDWEIEKTIPVWEVGAPQGGRMQVLVQTGEEGYLVDGEEYTIMDGKITITLPATSATVLKVIYR
ncbi:MAG: alpha-glycosidase [Lachnospiraceae bacterium]|nr:alpha-glycosidase [Lachnospiraceae bacterium]